jgi:hypothetical protein
MKSKKIAFGFFGALLVGGTQMMFACSSSSSNPSLPPGYTPDAGVIDARFGEDANHHGDAGRDGGDASDATSHDAHPDAPGLCTAPLSAPAIQELAQPGTAPPATGGSIAKGTYYLTHLYIYPGSDDAGGATGIEEQNTLVFGDETYTWAQASGAVDAGVGATTLTGGTWTAGGNTAVFTQTCPTSEAAVSYPYSTEGTGLFIYKGTTAEFYSPTM